MRIKKFMVAAALTTSLVMSTMTVSAAPQGSQTQGEMQYTTEASESDLAAYYAHYANNNGKSL